MTIQEVIKKHVTDDKARMRISNSFLRRSIDLMPVEEFKKQYNRQSLLNFPNIGEYTADILMEAINKEK